MARRIALRLPGMRRVLLGVAAVSFVATGNGVAGERAGRAVRVEAPRRVEVFVPAGTFTMGVDEDDAAAALAQCQLAYYPPGVVPQLLLAPGQFTDLCTEFHTDLVYMAPRTVSLDAYAIDRDEVSVEDYRRCAAAGGCTVDALVTGDERYIVDDGPMVNVTWHEALTYCRWRGARLPTEAEWERAARGDRAAATWPWGELEQPRDFNHGQPRALALREIDRQAATLPFRAFGDPDGGDGFMYLAPPGSYRWGDSPFGTRDQAGNVAEWTADAYLRETHNRGYENLARMNPVRDVGAALSRVVRGGSWRQPAFVARSHLRDPFNLMYEATQRYSHVGFRCARSAR